MKTMKLLVMAFALLVFNPIMKAQDYDYLQEARQRITKGDCDGAQRCYNVYKELHKKTDKTIERMIAECGDEKTNVSGKAGDPNDATAGDELTITANGVSFVMKRVAGGTFWMGSYDSDAYSDERPVHSVTLSTFYMGETEVTQALWKAVMGSEPTYYGGWEDKYGRGNYYPAYQVSWNDCQEFIRKLNQMTGRRFRLPTEAEWEYAARGGNQGHGYKYAGSNTIGNVAWYYDNSGNQTHQVATKSPNELGLYDMIGNVWEWCQDWYGSYGSNTQTDPQGSSSGSRRVNRGGCWYTYASTCRVSDRGRSEPDNKNCCGGFRLVLSQLEPTSILHIHIQGKTTVEDAKGNVSTTTNTVTETSRVY